MRLCLIVAVANAVTLYAQPPAKPAESRIVAVTVYQGTALVTREVTVPDAAGLAELVVSPLPAETVPASLYAEGGDGVRVLNTRFRSRAVAKDSRAEVAQLEQTIRETEQSLQRIQGESKTAEQNLALLAKLEGFTGATLVQLTDKGVLSSEQTIALSKYVMTSRAEINKELVNFTQQSAAGREQLTFLQRQLQEKAAGVSRTERDAVVVVDKGAGAGKVRLNYLVNNVSWQPQYKLRAGKDKDPVLVEYLAAVQQQCGEDWANVSLTLSTAQPMLNAAPPDLKSLELSAVPASAPNTAARKPGAYRDIVDQGKASRQQAQMLNNTKNFSEAGAAINSAAADEQAGELLASKDDILKAQVDGAGAADGPSVTYRLRGRLSLPSRPDELVLEVARLELTPEFFYKAVPVLTPHVYRQATLFNKSEYVLLPGEATMYLGTDFVGRMPLPLVAVGKPFTAGFGADPQLSATRQLVNKTRTTTGGNQVLTFEYRLQLQSYKAEPVRLQVWDRLPKAEAQSIAVSLVAQRPELSTDTLYSREDRPKNLLRWDVTLEPTQHAEKALAIDYTSRLELDRQMQIGTVLAK